MRNKRFHKRTLTLDKENKKFLGVCSGIARYLEVEAWSVRLVFMVSILFGGWFLIPLYFIAWFCLDDKPGAGISDIADSQPFRHFRTVDYRKQLYRNTEDGKFLGVCAGVADYLEVNVFAVRLVFLVLVFFTAALPLFLYFGAYFILEQKPHTRASRRDSRQRRTKRHAKMRAGMAAGMEAGMAVAQSMMDKNSKAGGGNAFHGGVGDDMHNGMHNDIHNDIDEDHLDDNVDDTGAPRSTMYSKRREFKYCARKFATLQGRLAKMEAYVTSNQFRLHREFKNI